MLTCAPRDASQTLLLVVCLLSAFTYASAGLLVQIGSADGSLPVGEFTLARGLLQPAAAGLLLRGERHQRRGVVLRRSCAGAPEHCGAEDLRCVRREPRQQLQVRQVAPALPMPAAAAPFELVIFLR